MTGIRHIQRTDLDADKWNACIDAAPNGLIYAYAFYLDAMCDNWDALVLHDYEAVMPLPWRKKWSIKYIYKPSFVNSLGVFGLPFTKYNVTDFLNAIPRTFLYCDMDLNEQNGELKQMPTSLKHVKRRVRNNYFLQLNQPYKSIYNHYKRLAKRKLDKAAEAGLLIKKNVNPKEVIDAYALHYSQKHASIPEEAYHKLTALCTGKNRKYVKTYLACFPDGELVAFYLLLEDQRYLYSLLGGSTLTGKASAAFYLLTDAAIHDHANSNKIFRFEGSDVSGIAFFNQQFGPYHINYIYFNFNALPWPLRLLKK